MAEKDDSAWVFDSLVGFLMGPIWSAPLMTFIEEKSLTFEPGVVDSKDYREVYHEYKNLVDLLLGCYMEDMGISPEQFERACTLNRSTRTPVPFHQSLFEQIWAANDYEVFKRMMIQKNLELQLQALKIIEQKFGLTDEPQSDKEKEIIDDELPVEELLRTESQVCDEKADVDVDVYVDVERGEDSIRLEHERLATEYKNGSVLFKQALKKSTDSSPILEDVEEEAEEKFCEDEHDEPSPDVSGTLKIVPTDNEGFSIKPKEEANAEDVRKRQLYLKAQRDKLVALKKRTRSRRLQADGPSARPSSARVLAEASVEGELSKAAQPTVDPSVLQVRRALAVRLKAEVVQK